MLNIIYALGIWEGGGLAYLQYLSSSYFTAESIYILDKRVKPHFMPPANSTCYFFSSNVVGRFRVFLFRHFILFPRFLFYPVGSTNEYFLNGLPSLSRLPTRYSRVYILLQNNLIFDSRAYLEFRRFYRLKLYILRRWFLLVSRQSDIILTQTQSMQKSVSSYFLLPPSFRKLQTFTDSPSFPKLSSSRFLGNTSSASSPIKLFYPASFLGHKNHFRAIQALNLIYASFGPVFVLYCTITNGDLSSLSARPGSVVPLGVISREEVFEMYQICDYLFFPSLCESLGLPLVEAQYHSLPIAASALDFVYESCDPCLTFNPYSVTSIASSLSSLL